MVTLLVLAIGREKVCESVTNPCDKSRAWEEGPVRGTAVSGRLGVASPPDPRNSSIGIDGEGDDDTIDNKG